VIEIDRASKSWGESHALREMSLSVAEGEFVVLVGESGSGKSTTLRLVNRLVQPTTGMVRVAGRDIATEDPIRLRRSMGTVFQRFQLFPHMTVAENVGLVPRLSGWNAADTESRTRELLELVGLEPGLYEGRYPRELSGGQQQRVGVARALAARPKILLMDEPFGALDPVTRDGLSRECRTLHGRLGLTTLMVTHDMTEALLLGDRIAVMHAGRVLQIGSPQELMREPADGRVRELLETPRRQVASLGTLAMSSGA